MKKLTAQSKMSSISRQIMQISYEMSAAQGNTHPASLREAVCKEHRLFFAEASVWLFYFVFLVFLIVIVVCFVFETVSPCSPAGLEFTL